ncbi:recombinase family protein [Brevibacillus massiliensis]|uniref:recombinase family protein n=1 Tax=Brevibacillus massiliensis TaxID=1118054 RepID=UPI00036EEA35|nr:recombinase family protein [Brevibacillus massiliensis]
MIGQSFVTNLPVAVYTRVSSEDQQERETIENQVEFATKYCDLHKLEIEDWFKDDGITGTIPLEDRPEGRRLIEAAKAGKIKLLLIFNLKRLGRSARVILNSVYELEKYGVKIRSMTEPFDTGDANGRFLLTILAGVAELDRETLLETMWHGANRAARKGKWLGGIVPYGYRKNEDGFLEVNENPIPSFYMSEADVIRLIFNRLANHGDSCITIADLLNSMGVPPSYVKDGRLVKKGKRKENTAGIWRPSRIRNIVVNSTYKGIHLYGKRTKKEREIIEREVPAIISEEIWEKAQKVLRDNQLEGVRNSKRNYLLRGLIKCGCCGLTYIGTAFYTSHQPRRVLKGYYICNGKHAYRGPMQGKCKAKNVPQQWIEEMVWQDCLAYINEPGEALNQLAAGVEEKQSEKISLESEKQAIQKSLLDKEYERQSMLDLFRKKLISFTDLESQISKINQEKTFLEERVRELEQQIRVDVEFESKMTNAFELLTSLRRKLSEDPSFVTKREVIKALVNKIVVHTLDDGDGGRPRASLSIEYSFSKGVIRTDTGSSSPPAEIVPGRRTPAGPVRS